VPFSQGSPQSELARGPVGEEYAKPMIATSDAHRLDAFGRHYTSHAAATRDHLRASFRGFAGRAVAPNESALHLARSLEFDYFIFLSHPWRRRKHHCGPGHHHVTVASAGTGRP